MLGWPTQFPPMGINKVHQIQIKSNVTLNCPTTSRLRCLLRQEPSKYISRINVLPQKVNRTLAQLFIHFLKPLWLYFYFRIKKQVQMGVRNKTQLYYSLHPLHNIRWLLYELHCSHEACLSTYVSIHSSPAFHYTPDSRGVSFSDFLRLLLIKLA